MKIKNGLIIDSSSYIASPNFDDRPLDIDIDLIVIHSISLPKGIFSGDAITKLFCNRFDIADFAAYPEFIASEFQTLASTRVSAHLLIRRDGTIIQYVPFTKRAWHAGISCFCGRDNCNDFSIGIEVEGTDDLPYEDIQYCQLARVTVSLLHAYPNITLDRIVGHSDIAPARKTDPGDFFDWQYYRRLLRTLLIPV